MKRVPPLMPATGPAAPVAAPVSAPVRPAPGAPHRDGQVRVKGPASDDRMSDRPLRTDGGATPRRAGDAPVQGQSSVAARLQAFGLQAPAKAIVITTAADLEALRGKTHLKGDLIISEAAGADLPWDALASLVEVDGRFTLEGAAGLRALDHLGALSKVRGTMYLGFNESLERVALPSLVEIGGALIVEANPRLVELSLPALLKVGRYLHVHEHANLVRLDAPKLASVGGDLSLSANRRLTGATLGAPVQVGGALEVVDNGAAAVRGLAVL